MRLMGLGRGLISYRPKGVVVVVDVSPAKQKVDFVTE